MIQIKQIPNYPIDSNCFVIFDKNEGKSCVIIDPGSKDNADLFKFIEHEKLTPLYIILTHEHFDHCWGVNGLRCRYPEVKLVCSAACSDAIQSIKKNFSVFYQQPGFELEPADIILDDIEWKLDWHDFSFYFFPAKGHSATGILFRYDAYLFTGDELIKDIKTVTKLKTGSKDGLIRSMKYINSLKGQNLIVCPGHGEIFALDNYELQYMIG